MYQKAEETKPLILQAKVVGIPDPTVTWYHDDKLLHTSSSRQTSKDKGIVTLSLSRTTTKHSGVYKCVAENRAGKAECSANVTVAGLC